MKGYQCSSCGKVYTYKRRACVKCGSNDFKEIELGETAKVITYTKLYVVPAGIEKVPLVLGIVEFSNGARLFGQIATDDPRVGMTVKPVYGKLRKINEKEIEGYYFVPA